MSWGGESPDRGQDFEAKRLTGAQFEDLENSQTLGVGAALPTVEAVGEGAGLVEIGASSGKAAWKRRLSPRHRQAVGTFFAPTSTTPVKKADKE